MTAPSKLMVEWLCYPEVEDWIARKVEQFVAAMPPVRALRMSLASTNTRLVDWLDHLVLANGAEAQNELADLGFEPEEVLAEPGDTVYHHPGTLLARVILRDDTGAAPGTVVAVAIHVENVREFLQTHQIAATIEGTPFSPYCRARMWQQNGREFLAVERRGHRGFVPVKMPSDYPLRYLHTFEQWATRPRKLDDVHSNTAQTLALARSSASELGTNMAAWIALTAERAYWQRRNQGKPKERQDKLGMGWANHDYYTFRSSRETFGALIQVLETLGFRPHKRFRASAEVGWGAQVMEQPACRMAVFVDLEMNSDEAADAQDQQEPSAMKLCCTLYGESMLVAGLYHMIGRFDQPEAVGLAERDVVGNPFANLRRAFAQEEHWNVHPGNGRAN